MGMGIPRARDEVGVGASGVDRLLLVGESCCWAPVAGCDLFPSLVLTLSRGSLLSSFSSLANGLSGSC